MPRNVGGDAGHKFGELTQFILGIVEARDEQRDNLKPQPHAVNAADAVEDWADASA